MWSVRRDLTCCRTSHTLPAIGRTKFYTSSRRLFKFRMQLSQNTARLVTGKITEARLTRSQTYVIQSKPFTLSKCQLISNIPRLVWRLSYLYAPIRLHCAIHRPIGNKMCFDGRGRALPLLHPSITEHPETTVFSKTDAVIFHVSHTHTFPL
jgi:hypothetical protein